MAKFPFTYHVGKWVLQKISINLPDGKHHNCHWSNTKYCSNITSLIKQLFIFVLKIPRGKMKYFKIYILNSY
jgi:hypothetical protein